MKNKTLIITYIIILACIAIGLLSFLVWGTWTGFNFENYDTELLYQENFNSSDINRLVANIKSFDFRIEESTTNDILVEVYGSEKQKNSIKVNLNNRELDINQTKKIVCFGFCFYKSEVIVYLPEYLSVDANIKTVSGDLHITPYLSGNKIELSTTSGDIWASVLGNATVSSTSGDIEIDSLNNGKVSSTSGDIKLTKITEGKISAISGNIEIESSENLDVTTTSGDITIGEVNKITASSTSGDIKIRNMTIEDDSKIETTSGDVVVNLFNEADVTASTISGDKNIRASKGNYKIEIKTISGDITVK